jgi:hypothetical protein
VTVQARRIAAIPRRSSVDTWRAISDLLARPATPARGELEAATGVAAMLIAEEYTRDAPVIMSGTGPQLRLYTLHGDEAIDADLDAETPFAFDPTDGDWSLSLPCGVDDLEEATQALSATAHITVREMTSETPVAAAALRASGKPVINLSELERP